MTKKNNLLIRRYVNQQTKQTPLHLAAEAGQLAVCETLLGLKADALAIDNVSGILCFFFIFEKIFHNDCDFSFYQIAFTNTTTFSR